MGTMGDEKKEEKIQNSLNAYRLNVCLRNFPVTWFLISNGGQRRLLNLRYGGLFIDRRNSV